MKPIQWIELDISEFRNLNHDVYCGTFRNPVLMYADRKVVKILVQLEDWEPGTYAVTKGEQALSTLHRAKELCEVGK
jgi:hypothetical protein